MPYRQTVIPPQRHPGKHDRVDLQMCCSTKRISQEKPKGAFDRMVVVARDPSADESMNQSINRSPNISKNESIDDDEYILASGNSHTRTHTIDSTPSHLVVVVWTDGFGSTSSKCTSTVIRVDY
jgi:hypothetical protein